MRAGMIVAGLVLLMPLLIGIVLIGRGSLADGAGQYRAGRLIAGIAVVLVGLLVRLAMRWL